MFDRIRRLLERHRDLRTLAALGDRDLADLGVSREQALALATLPEDVPGRVVAMARLFGLSEDELLRARAEWVELLETCAHCTTLAECRRFMAAGAPGGAEAVDFCPNRGHFESHSATA